MSSPAHTADNLHQYNRVVDHVQEDRGHEAAGFLEDQRIADAEQKDRRPRHCRVIDGEEGSAPDDGPPASPFPVERPEQEAAEQIFFGKGCEGDRHDGVGDAKAMELGHGFLRFAQDLGGGRRQA